MKNTATLSPDLPQLRAQAHHENLARYLATADLAELAHLTGALAAELGTVRGIPVADLMGGIQARIEAVRHLAALRAKLGHDDEDVAAIETTLQEHEDATPMAPPDVQAP